MIFPQETSFTCFGNGSKKTGLSNAFIMHAEALNTFYTTDIQDIYNSDTPAHGASYFHGVPAQMFVVEKFHGTDRWLQNPSIGYLVCESTELKPSFKKFSNRFDQLWTASTFCKEILERELSREVHVVPHYCREFAWRKKPEGPTTFLSVFDGSSRVLRKNPFKLVEGFRQAFGRKDNTRLVIKCKNIGAAVSKQLRTMVQDADIVIVEKDFSPEQMRDLYWQSHFYVSLHAGEGFCLPILEAMGCATPHIATNWSGPTDFMSTKSGYLVDYDLVDVEDEYFYGQWAQPNVDSYVECLREAAKMEDYDVMSTSAIERALRWDRIATVKATRFALS